MSRAAIEYRRQVLMATAVVAAGVLSVYLLVAYVMLPVFWEVDTRRAVFKDLPGITRTKDGIPGDPLNVVLAGNQSNLVCSMLKAGWHPADPTTLETAVHIAESAIFHRQYADAPVSPLYLYGRKQDLAFEQPTGGDARRRHHVRFWRCPQTDDEGRTLWVGAATFDVRVGLSHTTGQVTHHVSPTIDKERNKLISDLRRNNCLANVRWLSDFHKQRSGRNGGGDTWQTDGRLAYAVLVPTSQPSP